MTSIRALDDSSNAPWKERFRAPSVLYSRLAKAAPDRGLVVANNSGVCQLYAWDVPTGGLRQVTDDAAGKYLGYIQPDGMFVYYLLDRLGDEMGHFVRVPFDGGEPEDITPSMPPYNSFSVAVSRSANLVAMVAAESSDSGMSLVGIGVADGALLEPRTLHRSSFFGDVQVVAGHGQAVAVSVPAPDDASHLRILVVDPAGNELGELWDGPGSTLEPRLFSPDGGLRMLAVTNASGANRPLVWDVSTGERHDLAIDELPGEVQPADWSDDCRSVLLVHHHRAHQQLYVYDLAAQSLIRLAHPGGTFASETQPYFATSGEIYADWQDSTNPTRVVAIEALTGTYRRDVLSSGKVPPGHELHSVSFASSDGQEIQGWLGLPDGDGPFPTILHTHGGPAWVTNDEFSPYSQMWLDHGFAFLTINYRGSTTFGREFEEKIRGDLGHWEVEDMVAARGWLVRRGIAAPDRVIASGDSYGGFNTLMALGRSPDLWAGGLAYIPVVDWTMNYEDSAGSLRAYQEILLGGTPDQVPDRYCASSPLTYADRVIAPVHIIAGRNDTRCPARPIEVYAERLRDRGVPVEVEWFDAGHGSLVVAELIEHVAWQLRFALGLVTDRPRIDAGIERLAAGDRPACGRPDAP